ncbi:hypothetical protein J6590_066904 [Homalodisca vitripennis]|nr:hypothetical protein J6590_066904 [Homalodisca vitripennis]
MCLVNLSTSWLNTLKYWSKQQLRTDELTRLKGQVTSLTKQLNHKTDDFEQYQCQSCLLMFGVPETTGEGTERLVIDICQKQLCVHLHLLLTLGIGIVGMSEIIIREDLKKARLEVYRRAVAIFGLRNTWTLDGRTMYIDQKKWRCNATRMEDLPAAPTTTETSHAQ